MLQSDSFLKNQQPFAGHYFHAAIASGVVNGFLLIAQAWCLARIISGAVFDGRALSDFTPYFAVLLALFAARFVMSYLSSRLSYLGAFAVKNSLRAAMYQRLKELGPLGISRRGSGSALTTLMDGIEALEGYYARFIPAAALMVFVPLSILVFIFPADWISGLIMVLTAPMIPLFMVLIGNRARKLSQKQWNRLGRMSNHFLDALQGLTTLKLFNAARREGDLIARVSDEYRRDTMGVLRVAFLSSVTLEFFSTVSIALVAVVIGFRLLWGNMEFEHGLFVLLLAPEFYLPLRNMGGAYHARMEALGALGKITDVMEAPRPKGGSAKPDFTDLRIEFDDVHVTYEGERIALRGVSFVIEPGEKIALIGPSGAGKSTIMALLLGFVQPSKGRILLNGQDMAAMDVTHWRAQLGWVSQSPSLFYASVLDNIRLGAPDASREEVEALCRSIGIDDFIRSLPQGYDTPVGEQGFGLSGGQIQRIAIARALLRADAPLLLMDEPTASLDAKSERVMQQAVREHTKGRSVLSIAHRLHTVRDADRIVYLEDGKITASAPHEELAKAHKDYARLIAHEVLDVDLFAGAPSVKGKAPKGGGA